ncbi:YflJ family protein [Aquibacillus sp. 3ASR75-11]|uniref:YflJ family protein n=1 Tax=Terrihalobacillus insolitus TaxID=2950438 RepID=A0A9X4AP72_9BACI|nr:YflJ family protein [Terrihalobacillus insolitus]MDC3413464.1 YflJ family protein [Terrihalobacillus insolitus]MDC3425245.1 YflJ family protein [Terrihalobacillus insolitus]
MHVGSKGWYVEELKKLGVRYYEGRKIEKYKIHRLANLLDEKTGE